MLTISQCNLLNLLALSCWRNGNVSPISRVKGISFLCSDVTACTQYSAELQGVSCLAVSVIGQHSIQSRLTCFHLFISLDNLSTIRLSYGMVYLWYCSTGGGGENMFFCNLCEPKFWSVFVWNMTRQWLKFYLNWELSHFINETTALCTSSLPSQPWHSH